MRIVWRREAEEHHQLGRLVPGQTYDVAPELGAVWIAQGAAEAAGDAAVIDDDTLAAPAATEQEG